MSTFPAIGSKVYPLGRDGNWYGIPEFYRDKVGTVTDVRGDTDRYIVAEFQSQQKPDDTVQWSFYCWRPVVQVGDLVTVTEVEDGSYTDWIGQRCTIRSFDNSSLPYYVQKLDSEDTLWVVNVVPVSDGQTLTVSSPMPAVGDYVRMTARLSSVGIEHGEWYGVVTKIEGSLILVNVDGVDHATGPEAIEPAERPATPVEPAIITDLQAQIDTLTRELSRANERVNEYAARAGKWERDFDRYAQRIMLEANDRSWCDVYDGVMSEIQEDLEIAVIPEREQEVEIEWEETYTVTVRRSGTVTLRAGYDESDIDSAARNLNGDSDADRSEVIDAVRNGNYESDEFVDDSAQES